MNKKSIILIGISILIIASLAAINVSYRNYLPVISDYLDKTATCAPNPYPPPPGLGCRPTYNPYPHPPTETTSPPILTYQINLPIIYGLAALTPPPLGVQILPNHSSYVDSIDYLHVVGEIVNNTDDYLEFVRISANFFNASGQLLDTDFTYTYLDTLPAWDKTCFDVSVQVPLGWSYYQFEAPTYWTDADPLPNLQVINDSGSYDPYFGWYEIIGQVRNDHGMRVEYVSPVGTIYNNSGTVIGCDFTYVNSTNLEPGQISSFEMTFLGRDYFDVASYRLQVDGDPVK